MIANYLFMNVLKREKQLTMNRVTENEYILNIAFDGPLKQLLS